MKKILYLILILGFLITGCSESNENKVENEKDAVSNQNEGNSEQTSENAEENKKNSIDHQLVNNWLEMHKNFLSKQPMLGDENAPITMVEFADFKCSYCGKWKIEVFPVIKEKFIDTGKVKFIFVNLPFLTEGSMKTAVVGESIFNQNEEAFWTYYNLAHEFKGSLEKDETWGTDAYILDLAKDLNGIDLEKLKLDLENFETNSEIDSDMQFATIHEIQGTPSLIMNGYVIGNTFDLALIESFVDEYLKKNN